MKSITAIGPGNVGTAVAGLAAKGGATVQLLAREAAKAEVAAEQFGASSGAVGDPIQGDVVVLAVPYGAMGGIVAQYGSALDGKILVDVSNPVDMTTFDGLVVPADSSAAAELQKAAPGARVVKAFNTNFAGTVASGVVTDVPTTVLIAGDDADAVQAVSGVVTDGGLDAVHVGSLKRARELEALAFLQIGLAAQEKIGWTGGFALRK